MKNSFTLLYLFGILSLCSCYTSQNTFSSKDDASVLNWGQIDSTSIDSNYDSTGDGVFGRKIIYRDASLFKKLANTSGKIAVKVCINRMGLVTFVELIPSETTIADREILKTFLKAARKYKFEPLSTAPIQQCGKIKFKIENSVSNKLR